MNTEPRIDHRAHSLVGPSPSSARFFEGQLHMLPGVTVPLRSMLVHTHGDDILISPVGGDVEKHDVRPGAVLVAPSLLHHKHLTHAMEVHAPRAVWAPPGFADKLPALSPYVKTFGIDQWPYGDSLAFRLIEGAPKRNEVVFFHRATRTIYTADLVFNIIEPHGFLAPIAFRMMGVYRRFAMMKPWTKWVEDRDAFRRSIDAVLAWDFDRIAMAHGDIVATGGKQKLADALRERDLY